MSFRPFKREDLVLNKIYNNRDTNNFTPSWECSFMIAEETSRKKQVVQIPFPATFESPEQKTPPPKEEPKALSKAIKRPPLPPEAEMKTLSKEIKRPFQANVKALNEAVKRPPRQKQKS
ncbi:hypothetical protein CR513_56105, partial [Mucuna pruriens]